MIIPTIGSKGMITFSSPFDTETYKKKYEVVAIRKIIDFINNGEDPLNDIYLRQEMTKEDYEDDINKDVPIVVLKSIGNKTTYIPADRFLSLPTISGVEYSRNVISVNLGMLPASMSLENIMSDIADIVKDSIGIKPGVKVIPTSDICYKTKEEHEHFMSIINRNPNVQTYKSWRTKYIELTKDYESISNDYGLLRDFLSNNASHVIQNTDRPTEEDLKYYTKTIKIEFVSNSLNTYSGLYGFIPVRYNKLNTTPMNIYGKGFRSVNSSGTSYYGVLDNKHMDINLSEGRISQNILPYLFSDTFMVVTDPGVGIINIVLKEPINIRSYSMKVGCNDIINTQKVRITLYNKEDVKINVRTYTNGTDYNISGTGTDNSINPGELTLSEQYTTDAPLTPPTN